MPATKLAAGTIFVDVPERSLEAVGIYARVFCEDQKAHLDGRVFCGWPITVAKAGTEVGSDLNGLSLWRLAILRDPHIHVLVGKHRDRLARLGSKLAQGRRLAVADLSERKDDLVEDMIDVLTSLCARLDGRRLARHRENRMRRST